MDSEIRLHVGTGSCYLLGWRNVDLAESGAALFRDQPRRVKRWGTTEDQYYARHDPDTRTNLEMGVPASPSDMVCDEYGSWDKLPADDDSVSCILSRQCFEHLSLREATVAMIEARRVLKEGGLLRLDVPDCEATLEQYALHGGDFFKRHLLGSRKNHAAYHLVGWTRHSLIKFVTDHGFEYVEEEPNIHFYPAFCLKFRKAACLPAPLKPWNAAWEYCGDPLGTPLTFGDGKVLEIGPGSNPWPRADYWVDSDAAVIERLPIEERLFGTVENLPWQVKEFDFCYAAHVLEHTTDPVKAAAELSRVAHAGVVVCPSIYKDAMFNFHESDHKWSVLPSPPEGPMRFVRLDKEWRDKVHCPEFSGWIHRMTRYGDHRFGMEGHTMREFYHRAEPLFDVVVRWRGELRVEIVG